MEIRSVDTGAGTEQVFITCTASLIGADAGSIEVLKTLPFAMEVTEVRTVLTSKLVTAGATSLIRVTDGTNNIVADQSYALADAIGLLPGLPQSNGYSTVTDSHPGGGLVNQVDGLVRQKAVGYIT